MLNVSSKVNSKEGWSAAVDIFAHPPWIDHYAGMSEPVKKPEEAALDLAMRMVEIIESADEDIAFAAMGFLPTIYHLRRPPAGLLPLHHQGV